MKTITEKEYESALRVVRAYLVQIDYEVNPKKLTTFDEWVATPIVKDNYWRSGVIRLLNVLKHHQDKYQAIEYITKIDFLRYRNAGKKSWELFTELRGF